MTNDLLRDHVTSTGFALTLGKTHIAALVYIDLRLKAEAAGAGRFDFYSGYGPRGTMRRMLRNDVMANHGLEDRGLLVHTYEQNKHKYLLPGNEHAVDHEAMPYSECYQITTAGRHVIGLLAEAGIYAEYAAGVGAAVQATQEASEERQLRGMWRRGAQAS